MLTINSNINNKTINQSLFLKLPLIFDIYLDIVDKERIKNIKMFFIILANLIYIHIRIAIVVDSEVKSSMIISIETYLKRMMVYPWLLERKTLRLKEPN